jgi:uncharacterized protein involved in exopolysaccharide biosynthesis
MDELQKDNDEISIKDLILVLWKEKKLIVMLTAIFIVLGIAYALMQPKSYESSLTLLTSPISQSSAISTTDISGVVSSSGSSPQMNIMTYLEQFLNPIVVRNTIVELNLTEADGEPMERETLAAKVTVENPEDTNLLVIKVTDKDPELAAQIANTLGDQFVKFITDRNSESANSVAKELEIKVAEEKNKFDAETVRWRANIMQAEHISNLNREISLYSSLVDSHKNELVGLARDIVIYKNTLNVLLNGKSTVTALDLDALELSISGPNAGSYSIGINNQNQLQNSMLTMDITNLETALVRALERQKVLETEIARLEPQIPELRLQLNQEQFEYDEMIRDYEFAKSTYLTYQSRARELTLATVADIGRTSIQISSPAVPATIPSGMSRTMIVIIAALAGGMIAVFIAFFKAYWNSEISSALTSKETAIENNQE